MTEYQEITQHFTTVAECEREIAFQLRLGFSLTDSFPQYLMDLRNKFIHNKNTNIMKPTIIVQIKNGVIQSVKSSGHVKIITVDEDLAAVNMKYVHEKEVDEEFEHGQGHLLYPIKWRDQIKAIENE